MNQEADIVAFFLSMPKAHRQDFEALAELDRRFGEDVEAERRERPSDPKSARNRSTS